MRLTKVVILLGLFSLCPKSYCQQYTCGYRFPLEAMYMNNINNNFAAAGDNYIRGMPYWHSGLDIFCPVGTPVYSVADGIIVKCSPSGWDYESNGRQNFAMFIRNEEVTGETPTWGYGHLQRPKDDAGRPMSDLEIRDFRFGNTIKAGEFIGYIGKYGNSSHLHLVTYFDPNNPRELIESGYGRRPLPVPNNFDNFHDPLLWLKTHSPVSVNQSVKNIGCTLPTVSADQRHFYYLSARAEGEEIIYADLEGTNIKSFWKAPDNMQVQGIAPYDSGSIYLKLFSETDYSICQAFSNGKMQILMKNSFDFQLGPLVANRNYFPFLSLNPEKERTWEAFDLMNNRIVPRCDVLPEPSVLSSIFGGMSFWPLFGSTFDSNANRERLAVYLVDRENQSFQFISDPMLGDIRGSVRLRNSKTGDPDNSSRIAFSTRSDKYFEPCTGLIISEANDNPIKVKYQLRDINKLANFQNDAICFDRFTSIDGYNQVDNILIEALLGDIWQIWRVRANGSDLRQITNFK